MTHLTEEEQIALFKQWWKENGQSLIIGVVLALGAYGGWQVWSGAQQQAIEAASDQYQAVIDKGGVPDGQNKEEIAELVKSLKEESANTFYGHAATLQLAAIEVENGNLEEAAALLKEILAGSPDELLEYSTRVRLARVLFAQEQYDDALDQLRNPVPAGFVAVFAEVKGDVLAAQGHVKRARESYQLAVDKLSETGGQISVVETKLNDLTPVKSDEDLVDSVEEES